MTFSCLSLPAAAPNLEDDLSSMLCRTSALTFPNSERPLWTGCSALVSTRQLSALSKEEQIRQGGLAGLRIVDSIAFLLQIPWWQVFGHLPICPLCFIHHVLAAILVQWISKISWAGSRSCLEFAPPASDFQLYGICSLARKLHFAHACQCSLPFWKWYWMQNASKFILLTKPRVITKYRQEIWTDYKKLKV